MIERAAQLDPATRTAVRELARRIADRYGAPPLNDQTLAQLDQRAAHFLERRDGELVGYAQVAGDTAEFAAGTGEIEPLVDEVLAAHPGTLAVWAHGRRSPLTPAAERRGWHSARVLWQLRRPLTDLPRAPLPPGVAIRAFEPGRDEDAWLAVNAAAFAHHAEQGQVSRADLAAREAEDWFDPAGFLLAERAGELLGFHWTKVHPARGKEPARGEVYVLGVAPAAQGLRLGATLLAAGLRHLADRGLAEVLLYVDDDNAAALRLYESRGFDRYDRDEEYRLQSGQT